MRRSLSTVAMITCVMAVVGAFLGSHAPPAWACGPSITIAFHESSDGDIFIIKNNSEEAWFLASLEITLTGSVGRLVFDTQDGGPGFSMHAPFVPADNEVGLIAAPEIRDGAEEIWLQITKFIPGRDFTFLIDVDDRLETSDYGCAVVSGAEFEGARAKAALAKTSGEKSSAHGQFDNTAKVVLRGGTCA